MKSVRPLAVIAALVVVLSTLVPGWSSPAQAHDWAPAATAPVHPGVQVTTASGQCTSNFLFESGDRVMLGMAAHCGTMGGASDIDGCTTPSRPLGSEVTIQGATGKGHLVYSSWRAMQEADEVDPETCMYNDFALVEIDPVDLGRVNPTYPGVGGPVAVGSAEYGEKVYSHGRSGLRFGVASDKVGAVVGGAGWWRRVYTVTPGIPGDSGSGALNERGEAALVVTILEFAPRAASNRALELSHALDYARAHSPAEVDLTGLRLVAGTEPFNPTL